MGPTGKTGLTSEMKTRWRGAKSAHPSQTMDSNQIEESEEEFVSHQDRHEQVAQYKGTQMVPRIWELVQCGQYEADAVKGYTKYEEPSVSIEPQCKLCPPSCMLHWRFG